MEPCREISPLVTRAADNEAVASERARVDGHVRECAPCRSQLQAEREVRGLLHARQRALIGRAPVGLHAKCAAAHAQAPRIVQRLHPRLSRAPWPMALAATLVLALAGAAVYGLVVNPSKAVAAQLTLDHLKCFVLFEEPAGLSPQQVRAVLRSRLGMDIELPAGQAAAGLRLVGGRRCVYLEGALVHLMLRKGAVPVSLFVLPTGAKLSQTEMDVLGHSAVAFTKAGRTWVALARVTRAELEAIASAFGADGHD